MSAIGRSVSSTNFIPRINGKYFGGDETANHEDSKNCYGAPLPPASVCPNEEHGQPSISEAPYLRANR